MRRVEPPAVKNQAWSEHPVDLFVLAKLEEHGLQPAARADKRTLLRRATFALTGLPPTPDEIQTFLVDDSPQAFEAVIDQLLDSPRFGERWARHWMDLVRYCESHGSQGDPELPNAYQYRDYLIRAFNADVPYDQLVREHLAGDLLPQPRWNIDDDRKSAQRANTAGGGHRQSDRSLGSGPRRHRGHRRPGSRGRAEETRPVGERFAPRARCALEF